METHPVLKLAVKALFLTVALALVFALPVQSAELFAGATPSPWKVDLIFGDTNYTNISSAFGGPKQIPIISWYDPTFHSITMGHRHSIEDDWCIPAHPCIGFAAPIKPGAISAMVEYTFINSFKLGRVYISDTDGNVYLFYVEYDEDAVQLLGHDKTLIYQVPDGYTAVGRPALAFDSGGGAHAVVLLHHSDHFTELVYINYSNEYQTSCGFNSRYRCEDIKSRLDTDGGLGLKPDIVVTSSGSPRILLYEGLTSSLTYVYPATGIYPSNCGLEDPWRCVSISGAVQLESEIDMDIAEDQSRPQIAWTNIDSLGQTWVHHARYVGGSSNGGNCGEDYRITQVNPINIGLDDLWECSQAAQISSQAITGYVSLQVDRNNDPVIAFNRDNDYTIDLGVLYGKPGGIYTYQKIDGKGINTGREPSLVLDRFDRGFVTYIEDEEYSPNLKVAYQDSYIYLPLIRR